MHHNAISTAFIDHPVPIHHAKLLRAAADDQEIIDFFLKLKHNGTSDRTSNLTGWTSEWDSHLRYPLILDSLVREIAEFHSKFVMNPRHGSGTNDQLVLDAEIWFAEYNKGDYADEHNHTWSTRTSFVYFLGIEQDSSPLTFVQKYWRPEGTISTVKEMDLYVSSGTLVLFPGFINHKVRPTDGKRFVIAGNINDISEGNSDVTA